MEKTVKEIVKQVLTRKPTVTNREVVQITGFSRQAVHAHLRQLVKGGQIVKQGRGRGVVYRLAEPAQHPTTSASSPLVYPIKGLAEDKVWQELTSKLPMLQDLNQNTEHILHYGFTEILNNAIDHSSGDTAFIGVALSSANHFTLSIEDNGVGAFANIQRHFGLATPLHALELVHKGKATTQAQRHSGEGLFFVSKAFDWFELCSNGLCWQVDNVRNDFAVAASDLKTGTHVKLELANDTPRRLQDVFNAFTTDYEFDKTRVMVKLFALGTHFISRSEAKRLVQGFEDFKEVVLDFANVTSVGQGFCDEVFRVWANAHPNIHLRPVNMQSPVEFMVQRALASKRR